MKKAVAILLSILLIIGTLCACAKSDTKATENAEETSAPAEQTELVIFAAASMTETLERIAELYKETHPEITLTYNFDSSGTLKTQIEEGAVCDLFISAAQKQMDGLRDGGYINEDTRVNLLENKVALCVADNSKAEISSYNDMKAHLVAGDILMAVGNEDVPVGQYTRKIFDSFGLDENALKEKGVLTYGSNVKEVTTQISEGTVDCGVVYQTDAYSANLKVAATAAEGMCGKVIYPAAVLKNSAHTDEAKVFLDFLKTKEAGDIFAAVGFTPLT